jgi:peptidoglycan/xylan/chitin deacetylase (PgdA/CDA1 family)
MRAILTYHSIDSSNSVISTSEEIFRRQVRWLAGGHVRMVDIPELLRLDDDIDAVSLAFDDGFANLDSCAIPHLLGAGLTATVFVVTDWVGGTNSWEFKSGSDVPLLPLLDWSNLARLHEQGFRIASHTRSHARLTALPSSEVDDELAGSIERVKTELGFEPTLFAYPFGATNADVVEQVSRHFSQACTTEFRLVSDAENPHLLPRLDMCYFRDVSRLESFGTPAFRRYVRLRARGRRLRRVVPGLSKDQ